MLIPFNQSSVESHRKSHVHAKPQIVTYLSNSVCIMFNINSVFQARSVFEAASKKTDSGTEAKTEGLITLATVF